MTQNNINTEENLELFNNNFEKEEEEITLKNADKSKKKEENKKDLFEKLDVHSNLKV